MFSWMTADRYIYLMNSWLLWFNAQREREEKTWSYNEIRLPVYLWKWCINFNWAKIRSKANNRYLLELILIRNDWLWKNSKNRQEIPGPSYWISETKSHGFIQTDNTFAIILHNLEIYCETNKRTKQMKDRRVKTWTFLRLFNWVARK